MNRVPKQTKEYVGIDLGIKDFVVTSDGEVFENLHFKKNESQRIIRFQKQSSKTCNECGYVNKALKLSDRVWICPDCGKIIERDYNAALNILDEGKRILLLEK